jgi:hypothetical protein
VPVDRSGVRFRRRLLRSGQVRLGLLQPGHHESRVAPAPRAAFYCDSRFSLLGDPALHRLPLSRLRQGRPVSKQERVDRGLDPGRREETEQPVLQGRSDVTFLDLDGARVRHVAQTRTASMARQRVVHLAVIAAALHAASADPSRSGANTAAGKGRTMRAGCATAGPPWRRSVRAGAPAPARRRPA